MSKSRGNVLYADDMVAEFGVDAVRYFLLHEMPFENDGVVSWELLIERINSDLANTLGNLVNRTVSMVNKYFDGVVMNKGVNADVDEDLKKTVMDARIKVNQCMDKLRVADAITEVFNLFKRCNKYIDETMPWALAKEEGEQDRLATVLYNLVESITIGASLLEPFMPETSDRIVKQLSTEKRKVIELGTFGLYPSGNRVTDAPEILFARIDVEKKLEELAVKFPAPEPEPEVEKKPKKEEEKPAVIPSLDNIKKQEITIEEFDKMQLQIGEIISCEEVANSNKLICSQVQIAGRVLQIVSGIKKYYPPEVMKGKKVVVITNLKPVKLAGVLSEGMLLCAEDSNGGLSLLTVEDQSIEAGSMIS
jgi:methionyl-tRNA synthetase